MGNSTTLKTISSLLNISVSTVSRALKNHPDISEKTKKKVQELAQMMDYEPNAHAISLRTNTSKLLAVVVPALSNTFYTSFLTALEEESQKNGYTLITFQSADSSATELEILRICRINHIAGLFIAISPGTKNIDPFYRLEKNGVPVIFFDKVPAEENCNKVTIDDSQSAILAATAIVKSKKQKVLGIFGNREFSITKNREQAFIKYFQAQAPNTNITLLYAGSSNEAEKLCLDSIKKINPDVIFCMSDEILAGAIKAINRLKISIPGKLAVITISNGFLPTLFNPEITYIETSGYDLGKAAFKRFIQYLGGNTQPEQIVIPGKFVKGGSV